MASPAPLPKMRIPKETLDYCRRELEKGTLGMRGRFDGDYAQQLAGIVGECIIADMLGGLRPRVTNRPSPEYDFYHKGKKIEVKTMKRICDPLPEYACDVVESQLKLSTADIFIFCSVNTKELTISFCGWLEKDTFIQRAERRKRGELINRSDGTRMTAKVDFLEIPINKLNPWSTYAKN